MILDFIYIFLDLIQLSKQGALQKRNVLQNFMHLKIKGYCKTRFFILAPLSPVLEHRVLLGIQVAGKEEDFLEKLTKYTKKKLTFTRASQHFVTACSKALSQFQQCFKGRERSQKELNSYENQLLVSTPRTRQAASSKFISSTAAFSVVVFLELQGVLEHWHFQGVLQTAGKRKVKSVASAQLWVCGGGLLPVS